MVIILLSVYQFKSILLSGLRVLFPVDFFSKHLVGASEHPKLTILGLVNNHLFLSLGMCCNPNHFIQIASEVPVIAARKDFSILKLHKRSILSCFCANEENAH